MKVCVWSVTLYGCEMWAIRKEKKNRLTSFECAPEECYRLVGKKNFKQGSLPESTKKKHRRTKLK